MARANRWAYMGQPNFNPPNNDCPECTESSKTHHQGSKTTFDENGKAHMKVTRFTCEHGHEWVVEEPR